MTCLAVILGAALSAMPAFAGAADDDPEPLPPPIAMADFNRDGLPDMARIVMPSEGNSGPGLLSVWLGQKDGSFAQLASTLALGHDPRSIVAGDFNGDGIPDLVVGDGDGSLIELLGDGSGKLLVSGPIAHFSSIASVAVGDFNRDGVLDMVISDSRASTVVVLLGTGHGEFRTVWTLPLVKGGSGVAHIATADFNGDGIPDLAITNEDADSFEVLLGTGNGTFADAPALSKVRNPLSHCAS